MRTTKTKDGFETLFSDEYGQTYHSQHGVLQEAQHVFLEATGVQERLKKSLKTAVLEIGFGTGFNFLLTAKEAIANKAPLEYAALEKSLLSLKVLQNLNYDQLSPQTDLRDRFLEWRKKQPQKIANGKYILQPHALTCLTLFIGDARDISLPKEQFDAVYLDAFSPDKNPELWSVAFFNKLFLTMKAGSILSTYSAKGSVKRAMQEAGFQVLKKDGPPGKREMLIAKKI